MNNMLESVEIWLRDVGFGAATKVCFAVLILLVGWWLIQWILKLEQKTLEKTKLDKAAHGMVLSLSRAALYVVILISIASALGIDITGIVAIASVLTLAVSLATQSVLTNVVGGFTILTTQPFHSGDFVTIDGIDGTVDVISMTYTKIITPQNHVVSIPNSTVSGARIINYTAAGKRRVEIDVSADYASRPADVIRALLRAAEVEHALTDPAPAAVLTGYGENSIQYTLHVWVRPEHYLDVRFAVLQRIGETFAENGVEFSYPHMNIHMLEK